MPTVNDAIDTAPPRSILDRLLGRGAEKPTGLASHDRLEREAAVAAVPAEARAAAQEESERVANERHDAIVERWHDSTKTVRALWARGHLGPAAQKLRPAYLQLLEALRVEVFPVERLASDRTDHAVFVAAPVFLDDLVDEHVEAAASLVGAPGWSVDWASRAHPGLADAMHAGDRELIAWLVTAEIAARKSVRPAPERSAIARDRFALVRRCATRGANARLVAPFDAAAIARWEAEERRQADEAQARANAERVRKRRERSLGVRF